jgi:hypothetical protein
MLLTKWTYFWAWDRVAGRQIVIEKEEKFYGCGPPEVSYHKCGSADELNMMDYNIIRKTSRPHVKTEMQKCICCDFKANPQSGYFDKNGRCQNCQKKV